MNNFYLDFYTDLDDVDSYVEFDLDNFYDDGVDDDDYVVTGCDPVEFEDVPF